MAFPKGLGPGSCQNSVSVAWCCSAHGCLQGTWVLALPKHRDTRPGWLQTLLQLTLLHVPSSRLRDPGSPGTRCPSLLAPRGKGSLR